MDPPQPEGNPARTAAVLGWTGNLIAFLAAATYFLVVPRWPDLRDSGLPSLVLAGAGALVSLEGLRRALRARRGRLWSVVGAGLSLFAVGFLAFYIHFLSYRLPGTEGVIAVGTPAPSIALRDQEGRERTLEQFAGRPAFLVFFRGHW